MTVVELFDKTTYLINTEDKNLARIIVEYKLHNRLDYRPIKSAQIFPGILEPNDKYFNSGELSNTEPLKAYEGWSYKWSDTKHAEFR